MNEIPWKPGLQLPQDPAAVLDYVLDFGPYLAGDTISSATVTGTGCTATKQASDGTTVIARISGVSGAAAVTVAIVRASGQVDNRTVHFTPRDY